MRTDWSPPPVPNEVPPEVNNALATTLTNGIKRAQSRSEELAPHHIAEELVAPERSHSLVVWLLKTEEPRN